MSTITKKEFFRKEKIRRLPEKERRKRWDQHMQDVGRGTRVRGRGSYFTDVRDFARKHIPKGIAEQVGGVIGGAFGQGDLGRMAGKSFSQATGMGDYAVKTNSLMDNPGSLKNMSFSDIGSAYIEIDKREYLGEVITPADPKAFTMNRFRLQPTDPKTFPYLHVIGDRFSEWQLKGCIFTYETDSSNYAAGGGLGNVTMATQYNAGEDAFDDLEHMLQSPWNTSGNPAESLGHGIECDPELQEKEQLYTRREGVNVNSPNLYDHGIFTIATSGLPSQPGTVHGRLYVTYKIKLALGSLPHDSHLGAPLSVADLGDSLFKDKCPLGSLGQLADTVMTGVEHIMPQTNAIGFMQLGEEVVVSPSADGLAPKPRRSEGVVAWLNNDLADPLTVHMGFNRPGIFLLTIATDIIGGQQTPVQLGTTQSGFREQNGHGWITYPQVTHPLSADGYYAKGSGIAVSTVMSTPATFSAGSHTGIYYQFIITVDDTSDSQYDTPQITLSTPSGLTPTEASLSAWSLVRIATVSSPRIASQVENESSRARLTRENVVRYLEALSSADGIEEFNFLECN